VPDIPYGATADEAEEQLEDVELELGDVNETPSAEISQGGVVAQDPLPGTEVDEGTAVDITVSSGPPPEISQPELSQPELSQPEQPDNGGGNGDEGGGNGVEGGGNGVQGGGNGGGGRGGGEAQEVQEEVLEDAGGG
jgi:serine/threonine-protein kinase